MIFNICRLPPLRFQQLRATSPPSAAAFPRYPAVFIPLGNLLRVSAISCDILHGPSDCLRFSNCRLQFLPHRVSVIFRASHPPPPSAILFIISRQSTIFLSFSFSFHDSLQFLKFSLLSHTVQQFARASIFAGIIFRLYAKISASFCSFWRNYGVARFSPPLFEARRKCRFFYLVAFSHEAENSPLEDFAQRSSFAVFVSDI